MNELLVITIFGFPAAFVSLALSIAGVLKNRFWLVIIGAVFLVPFSYYMNGYPSLRGFAILLPLFLMGSAAAVRENNKIWAWILLMPAVIAGLWILAVVLISSV